MGEPLVDVTGARRRRARARLRRRLTVAGLVLGVISLVGGGAWVVYGSPWLAATELRVTGNALLTTEQVAEAAAVPLGGALAAVDTEAAAKRVGEALPAVASVRVGRAWPHAVTVDVTEATAVVALEVPGTYVWVAADGRAFHSTPERPAGVVLARGNVPDEQVLATLARVAGDLPEPVRTQADFIEAQSVDSVAVSLRDGRSVLWGSADDAVLKRDVLLALLQVKAKVYDVSAPANPTTR